MASRSWKQVWISVVCFTLLTDLPAASSLSTVENYCPDRGRVAHGNWALDEKDGVFRCILKCHSGYEATGCVVIRKDGFDNWTPAIPECKEKSWVDKETAICYAAAISLILTSPYLLYAMGFTTAGIAAASLAAKLMSWGFITKGSFFAWLQSLGMTGIGVKAKTFLFAKLTAVCHGVSLESLFNTCEEI